MLPSSSLTRGLTGRVPHRASAGHIRLRSGALAEFLEAAFPGQSAGKVRPGGLMAVVSQHTQGIHPLRACPACRVENFFILRPGSPTAILTAPVGYI